ncbi:MAG: SpoIIE family protein phosphatase [Atopobiaceae bacterium]
MIADFQLALVVALSCVLSGLVWKLDERNMAKRGDGRARSVVIGAVFGLAAIMSTRFGVQTDLAVLNVRDSFPLIAGLIFDPWAGVIAGVIGGVDRFIAGTWLGIGSYTTLACSISTVFAGLVGALLGVRVFERKKPSPFYAFTTAAMVEVFHMLAILLTHMDDAVRAFGVVQSISTPMILGNAAALTISSLVISIMSGRFKRGIHRQDQSERPITKTFQVWLLGFIVVLFVLVFSFTFSAQTKITMTNVQSTMKLNADDIESEMDSRADQLKNAKALLSEQARSSSRSVANDVTNARSTGGLSNDFLRSLASSYNIYEVDVIGTDGRISYSTNDAYVGYDMASAAQSSAFLVLLDGSTTDYLQDFQPIGYDASIQLMYAGTAISGGFVQVGYDSSRISEYESLADVNTVVKTRRIGQNGYALLADKSGTVIGGTSDDLGKSLSDLGVSQTTTGDAYFPATVGGVESYCLLRNIANTDYQLLLVMPNSEVFSNRDIFAYETAFMYLLLFSIVFTVIYQLVKTVIVKNLRKVNDSLGRITQGQLDEVVDVHASVEFTSLSRDINSTVATLKLFIEQAEKRIDQELEFARSIQLSAIPHETTPFAERPEFDLSASMHTAKEVGGDFYDYFMIDGRTLVMVMADVSGKGIPAALFMMKSKTLIKSLVMGGGVSPADILMLANHELCEGNDAEMFVTAWMGILDVRSGKMTCSNAGHEYPAIRRAGGTFELFRDRHGLVLGGMDGVTYRDYELDLHPGDELYLYTDGVTEATDASNELYGEERLVSALDATDGMKSHEVLAAMKADIDRFVGDAPQFDDITMMCLRFAGRDGFAALENPASHLDVDANIDELDHVQGFVEAVAEKGGAGPKALNQIALVVEEVFVNIAHYAYGGELGPCSIECTCKDGLLVIRFADKGIAYDPLAREDPDITLSAEDRQIGGLGIFLTKTLMDTASYERAGDENVLTLTKGVL